MHTHAVKPALQSRDVSLQDSTLAPRWQHAPGQPLHRVERRQGRAQPVVCKSCVSQMPDGKERVVAIALKLGVDAAARERLAHLRSDDGDLRRPILHAVF